MKNKHHHFLQKYLKDCMTKPLKTWQEKKPTLKMQMANAPFPSSPQVYLLTQVWGQKGFESLEGQERKFC